MNTFSRLFPLKVSLFSPDEVLRVSDVVRESDVRLVSMIDWRPNATVEDVRYVKVNLHEKANMLQLAEVFVYASLCELVQIEVYVIDGLQMSW